MKKKIAIIGTNGIPAKYGGFESLVEYLSEYLSESFEITVFCSSKVQKEKSEFYKGVHLSYIHLKANGWQGIIFDFLSLLKCYRKYDKILILGCSGSFFQPLFYKYKHKMIMNLGGLDWQRSKWNYIISKYLKLSERFGVMYSGKIIADNEGMREYIFEEYGVNSDVIAYGGSHTFKVLPSPDDIIKYPFLQQKFGFTVARIQPDNNLEMLCNSFIHDAPFPLVIVGNWSSSSYGRRIKTEFEVNSSLVLLDAIYDQKELNLLRSNCFVYIHGHSAGGTNPALVEAMSLGLPIFAFNNNFNKYTTENCAEYFSNSAVLKDKLSVVSADQLNENARNMKRIAQSRYTWKNICMEYSKIFNLES